MNLLVDRHDDQQLYQSDQNPQTRSASNDPARTRFRFVQQITFLFLFLHFNDNQQHEVREWFLKLEDLERKKDADIAKLILNVLEEKELDIKNSRGQGNDNGANMVGIYIGV